MLNMQNIEVNGKNEINLEHYFVFVGDTTAPIKVAIIGNSITRHKIKEDIGWDRECGMAASDEEHDYVHILHKKLADAGINCCFMVSGGYYWEQYYFEKIDELYSEIKTFSPDYIIFRLGENINQSRAELACFQERMKEFLEYLSNQNTKVIMTTCFWKKEKVDACIRNLAKQNNYSLVELGDLGDGTDMRALGLFEHNGVAAHPGDKGMENIAQRIFSVIYG